MANPWFLAFHLIGIIIYVGGLLNLSRLLAYHVKEAEPVRIRLSRIEKRTYFFFNLPGLVITLTFGLLMLFGVGREGGAGEGILNYIRPNEQVLVLERDVHEGQLAKGVVPYQKAIDASSFKEENLPDGKFKYTYEYRGLNQAGVTIAKAETLTLSEAATLYKERTHWGAVFHLKLVLAVVLILIDLSILRQILAMARDPSQVPNGRRFKIFHGLIALIMITMVILVKTRVGLGGV